MGLKKFGKTLAFETYIEFYKDEILNYIRLLWAGITPQDISKMVAESIAPPIPKDSLEKLRGYEEFLEGITPQRLYEFINDARPDLALALAETGDAAVGYIISLKKYLMAQITAEKEGETAEEAVEETQEENQPPVKLYSCTCDSCGKTLPVTKEAFEAMRVCPFCGVEKGEPTSEQEL